MKKAIIAGAVFAAVSLTGCGHNINVQGFGLATPYMAIGYGSFSCVKDNVKVTAKEKTTKEGVESINTFIVNKQTTGYDVDLAKVTNKGEEK